MADEEAATRVGAFGLVLFSFGIVGLSCYLQAYYIIWAYMMLMGLLSVIAGWKGMGKDSDAK